ncbi:hypothetical protein Palpr_2380 [Paludibacter propionicigenes WB4]|uniref:DUF4062 domain-containing protein n=1 Tax=Paludibacter propionicigenes (strain DSM 17365 / JCM 13257 / WB4) TaxID=694427 RepID=E4T718_PALPW|nr:DUF4062 domain-containing protein [Paludibacter propionicigenes]ADQ80512.1 hypothetical protein Palpr_2380 [Paludibacter propionicigenes WB4]
MEKRYQVFVSSTYQDLVEERIEVIQALLELDCIPVGMEYFPAADETQWDFIKKLIDESDYYVVIIAGKYGSEDEKGISYTQKEYEYALSKGIPIISFIHDDIDSLPSSKTEKDKKKIAKLEAFKENVKKKLCKYWNNPQGLGAVVSRSISQAKKNYPRIGWVRADSYSETSEKEVVQLYKRIEILEKQLNEKSTFNQTKIENLAGDNESIEIFVDVEFGPWGKRKIERKSLILTWNKVAYYMFPKLIEPQRETAIKSHVSTFLKEIYLNENIGTEFDDHISLKVSNVFYDTLKIQFQLLDLIKYYDTEVTNDEGTKTVKMGVLTEKGKEKLISLRAVIKK